MRRPYSAQGQLGAAAEVTIPGSWSVCLRVIPEGLKPASLWNAFTARVNSLLKKFEETEKVEEEKWQGLKPANISARYCPTEVVPLLQDLSQ